MYNQSPLNNGLISSVTDKIVLMNKTNYFLSIKYLLSLVNWYTNRKSVFQWKVNCTYSDRFDFELI